MTSQAVQEILFDGHNLDLGIEEKLWDAANSLRSNSTYKASEYATPVLGLIFLRYASNKFALAKPLVEAEKQPWDSEEDIIKIYIQKCGFYLPEQARYDYLLEGKYKTESNNTKTIQKAIIEAMESIEVYNDDLKGTLPKEQYNKIDDEKVLTDLLRALSIIPVNIEGDLFGRIYEYFLGKFALSEGQKGGQFFTPTSIVKLIVEVIEPFNGRIFDPACGSGGMFVQSSKFVKKNQKDNGKLVICGQEKMGDTINLAKMNLAVNGLESEIFKGDSYKNDPFEIDEHIMEYGHGQFDYVMANPPFNVKKVAATDIKSKHRFNKYGLPIKEGEKYKEFGNANYLWANLFASALNETGRAGFVMANSASDARGQELNVRKNLIEADLVDVMMSISSNFFLSVTLPITIWFYDKAKTPDRKDKTLFIDARNIYTQVTRALRTFTQAQLYDVVAIVWLYRNETENYKNLLATYRQALALWTNGTIENPTNKALPYQGEIASNEATQTALARLEKTIKQWYKPIEGTLKGKKATAEKTFDFANKLQTIPTETVEKFKYLQELVAFADKNLRPKGDKTFNDLSIKMLLKQAIVAYEHLQLIQERIAYFEEHLAWHQANFPEGKFADVEGLCKIADKAEIEEQNYSLNSGRYVGVALEEDNLTAAEFKTEMVELHQQLLQLNTEAHDLESLINQNLEEVL